MDLNVSSVSKTVGLAGLMLGPATFSVQPANAQTTIQVYDNQTITAGGILFKITGCQFRNNTTAALAPCTSGVSGSPLDELTAAANTVRGVGASFTLTGAKGGDLLPAPTTNGNISELKFSLAVNANPSHPVNAATLSDSISRGSSASASVSIREGVSPNLFASPPWSATALAITSTKGGTSTATPISASPWVTSPFTVDFDFQLTSTAASKSTNSLKLSSVAFTFKPAPEPLSLGVFTVGLVGLGAARRSRKKSSEVV
jgi:hypothetical protein